MNIQIQDILSNPLLLKDIPDEVLQTWIQQYPYVQILHLYALKNKKNHTAADLHKTAFYFNNREKLYFLLNQNDNSAKKNNVIIPDENKKITPEISEEKTVIAQDTELPVSDDIKTEVINEEIIKPVENIAHDESETINFYTEDEIKNKNEEPVIEISTVENIVNTNIDSDIKPLSIAETILAEISQIKQDRHKQEHLIADKHQSVSTGTDIILNDDVVENANTETVSPTTEDIKNETSIELNQDQFIEKTKDKNKEVEIKQIEFVEEIAPFGDAYPAPLLVHIPLTITEDKKNSGIIQKEETVIKDNIAEPAEIKEALTLPVEINQVQSHEQSIDTKENIIEKTDYIKKYIENSVDAPSIVEDVKETPLLLNETTIKEPHTFIEWLKLLDKNVPIQTNDIPDEKEWIEIPQYEVLQTIANKKQIQEEEAKIFEPNFEEGEIDLFDEIDEKVTKVATESVSFKDDMMTETLAKIYEKQGKTDKALEIYNTLRLKFPEKSSYFADLIQKLQKQ